jgi:hypothetical protein
MGRHALADMVRIWQAQVATLACQCVILQFQHFFGMFNSGWSNFQAT